MHVIKDVWKFVNDFAKICQAYCGVLQAFPYDRLMFKWRWKTHNAPGSWHLP